MKGIILVAFLASWTVINASKLPDTLAQNECPAKDTCPPTLLAHETNCAQYYECVNGQKQLRACASGLYFSKHWRGCVNWDISDCSITTTTTSPTPPWTPPPTLPPRDCSRNGDLLAHECQCDKYYECMNGFKALRECPTGQIFDAASRSCRNGNKVTCKFDEQPGVCLGNERKAHDWECQKYLECVNGNWDLRDCGVGWHFDNWSRACVPGACQNMKTIHRTRYIGISGQQIGHCDAP